MKKIYKKSKGITLIALIITIIVLLILTGVGIVYISGDTGILDKTIFARETHKKQKIRESLNLELNNILTGQISEHKETSKELSLEEFGKLDYEVEKEDDTCYIIEQGYIYEIEEKEDGYQEVVFYGSATKRKPNIMKLELSIDENSQLKISTKAKRAEEYKYEVILGEKRIAKIETENTSEYVDYYVDLKKLDEENNNSVFGTLKVKVTAYNENNKGLFNYDKNDTKYNKERDINVSKITFDTNDGQFENGEKTFIAFLETGKGFNTINLADLTNPIRSHYTFAGWYIPGDPVERELEIEKTTTDKLPVDLIINAHWTDVSHDYSIEVSKVEPTCETEGSKEMHCSIEGCTDPIQIITIAALGHDYATEFTVDKEPTCTEKGEKSIHCTRKNCINTKDKTEIAALGHSYGDYTVTTPASCTQDGVETAYCTVCNTPKTRTITALGHTPGPAATCTTPQTCTVCGDVLQAASGAHDYGDWTVVTAAKCEAKGSEKRVCKRTGCGDTQTRDITALGHDWGDYVTTKAATCSATGVETSTCKRTGCGKTRTNTLATNSNHSYATSLSKKDNTNHGYKCTLCGNAWSSLTSHSWGGWTKYSSSNNSYKTNHYATCSVCKGTKSASHSITTKYVTWTGDRHWLYDYCKTCGYEYNTGNYESHSISWGSWQNKSAGCYRSGKCSKCTYTTSQSKSSHSYTVAVTCKNGSPATVKKCSYCGRCSRCGATH